MKNPIDNFSKQSGVYKKFRPSYPKSIYDYVFSYCNHFDTAWDCATGNGQVASILSETFQSVLATDISDQQLKHADKKQNIEYSLQRAEKTNLKDESIDLITVAQAVHWFDLDGFSHEAKRVLKPDGVIAIWGYGLGRISPKIDQAVDYFYREIVGDYWNFERRHIEEGYKNLHLQLNEINSNHNFSIKNQWNLHQFEGFFNSWSAVQNYMKVHDGLNPVPDLVEQVKNHWHQEVMEVSFPIFLKLYSK